MYSISADKHRSFLSKPGSFYIWKMPYPPSKCMWVVLNHSESHSSSCRHNPSRAQYSRQSHQGVRCMNKAIVDHPGHHSISKTNRCQVTSVNIKRGRRTTVLRSVLSLMPLKWLKMIKLLLANHGP